MSKRRIAVALGGNALGESPADQIAAVRRASVMIADMIAQGHELIISHGNGPQVGMIHAAMDLAACEKPGFPAFPGRAGSRPGHSTAGTPSAGRTGPGVP